MDDNPRSNDGGTALLDQRRATPTLEKSGRGGGCGEHDQDPDDRPGACSLDVLALVHQVMFGCGPRPSSGLSLREASMRGLLESSACRVSPRGEQALAEHGFLQATSAEEDLAWSMHSGVAG